MKKRSSDFGLEKFEQLKALLYALSNDLSLPFLQVKTSLELIENDHPKDLQRHLHNAVLSTEAGLQLIEAYRLTLNSQDYTNSKLEPVAIGAVLREVADQLKPYADQYATDLVIDVRGKLTPVLAHRPSLVAALQCLSASMIRAQAATSQQKRYELLLGAHRSANNVITTGVFSNTQGLSDAALRKAHNIVGRARQPLPNVPAGAASGVLIADMLCAAMWGPLRAAAHHKMSGLVTTVPISKQLQFI